MTRIILEYNPMFGMTHGAAPALFEYGRLPQIPTCYDWK
jgi:hypothetical protein